MMPLKHSCKGCPDRQIEPVNCHSYCEKYLNAVAEQKAMKLKMNSEKGIEHLQYTRESIVADKNKMRKRKGYRYKIR